MISIIQKCGRIRVKSRHSTSNEENAIRVVQFEFRRMDSTKAFCPPRISPDSVINLRLFYVTFFT